MAELTADATRGFNPMDFPAGYANDVMRHVVAHNCTGCTVPSAESVAEFGPGGSCGVLAEIFVSDDIADLTYDGTVVQCLARQGASDAT